PPWRRARRRPPPRPPAGAGGSSVGHPGSDAERTVDIPRGGGEFVQVIARGSGEIDPPPTRLWRDGRRHLQLPETGAIGPDLHPDRAAKSFVGPLADDSGAHVQDASRTAPAHAPGKADRRARTRDVVDLALLTPAGQVGEELGGMQVPPLQLQRSEPYPLAGGSAPIAQRLARLGETAARRPE